MNMVDDDYVPSHEWHEYREQPHLCLHDDYRVLDDGVANSDGQQRSSCCGWAASVDRWDEWDRPDGVLAAERAERTALRDSRRVVGGGDDA